MVADFIIHHGYFIFLLLIIVVLIFSGIYSNKTILKQILYNLAAIFVALALYESFLWIKERPARDKSYNIGSYSGKGYFKGSDVLGYRPADSGVFTSRKYSSGGVLIYDVSYTLKNGIRFTPNSNENSQEAAVFFGCSVTFGEGVNDTATLPFYFNEAAGHYYKILNYGFHGYGPHHMLAIAEGRLHDDLVNANVTKAIAFYSFIPDHIRRCAGYSKWDSNGPRYEIKDGILTRQGNFIKNRNLILNSEYLTKTWESSYTFKDNFSVESKKATHDDVVRTLEIIRKTNMILQNEGIRFNIIVWNHRKEIERVDKEELNYLYYSMKQLNIPVYFVSDTVDPDRYESKKELYSIKNDGHPSPFFHKTVADYVYYGMNK